MSRLRRMMRMPLAHFLLLGLLAQVSAQVMAGDPRRDLVIDPARVAELRESWQQSTGRAPGEAKQSELMAEAVDEEILFQEALRRGLDRLPVVRRRLVQLARYLELGEAESEDGEFARRAVAIGLDRRDRIVRRYLVAAAREQLRAEQRVRPPSEQELADYLRDHIEEYALPRRIRLSHVFVGGHGEASLKRIEVLRRQILEGTLAPGEAAELGDRFYGGHDLPLQSGRRLAATLGPELAAAALSLPVATWSRPRTSPYGHHLLWVGEVAQEAAPELAAVRERIARQLTARRITLQLEEVLRTLRERYVVRLADDRVAGTGITPNPS